MSDLPEVKPGQLWEYEAFDDALRSRFVRVLTVYETDARCRTWWSDNVGRKLNKRLSWARFSDMRLVETSPGVPASPKEDR